MNAATIIRNDTGMIIAAMQLRFPFIALILKQLQMAVVDSNKQGFLITRKLNRLYASYFTLHAA